MPRLTNRQRGCCKRGHKMDFATLENVMQDAKGDRCRICWEISLAVAHNNRDRLVRAKREMALKVKIRHVKRGPQTPLTEHVLAVTREKLKKVQRPPNPFPPRNAPFAQPAEPAEPEMSDEEFERMKQTIGADVVHEEGEE